MFVNLLIVTQSKLLDGFNIGSGYEVLLFLSFKIFPGREFEQDVPSHLLYLDLLCKFLSPYFTIKIIIEIVSPCFLTPRIDVLPYSEK